MRPYARIQRWMIVECLEPDGATHSHLQGYLASHDRLSGDGENLGEPYIGTELQSIDLAAGTVVNRSGKVIALIGPALPEDEQPADLLAMRQRAERAWRLPAGTTWRRLA